MICVVFIVLCSLLWLLVGLLMIGLFFIDVVFLVFLLIGGYFVVDDMVL